MPRLFSHQNLDSTLEDTGEWPWFSVDVTRADTPIDDLTKEGFFGEVRFRDRVSKTSTGAVSSYTMQLAFPEDLRSETVLESVRAMTAQIPVLMIQARGARFEERLRKIAEAYVIDDPLDDAYLALHEQQLQARQRLLKLMPMLEAKHVAKFAGHENKNTAQTASRWKSAGKLFSVPVSGTERYPEFQFKDGLPKPIIEELILILNPRIEWDLAFWFASANGWLDGAAPMLMIDEHPERVLKAARHANDQISD